MNGFKSDLDLLLYRISTQSFTTIKANHRRSLKSYSSKTDCNSYQISSTVFKFIENTHLITMTMNSAIYFLYTSCIILGHVFIRTEGHGRLLEPPGRSSMWRKGFTTPVNYDDNQLFCGGYDVQWNQNNGRCGVCGDPYNGARENEAGGKYATGTISRHYTSGQTISATIDVTTNHGGFFEFRLCPVNNPLARATESCFNQHLLAQPNAQTKWNLPTGTRQFSVNLVLPRGLTCTQCVLQWKWTTASNWGCDASNNCCKGCGPQETFMGCSDIAIGSTSGLANNVNPLVNSVFSGGYNAQGTGGAVVQGGAQVAGIGAAVLGSVVSGGVGSVGSGSGGFIPVGAGSSSPCVATAQWKAKYAYADNWCQVQCPTGNCPIQYCSDSCRQRSG